MTKAFLFVSGILLRSCVHTGSNETKYASEEPVVAETISLTPEFNADSAYTSDARQVDFGSRVSNTAAHKACGD